ncbi:MAG: hypothetical protein SchgKO_16150 [Schleiferiaceae bacterium]
MKINKTISINATEEIVWKILAEDFDKASEWMSAVPHSYEIVDGDTVQNSPMVGRVCELSDKPNGPIADERISLFDAQSKVLHVEVVPQNAPLPIVKNHLELSLLKEGAEETRVNLAADIQLTTAGKVVSPVLKLGLAKAFDELLEELKYFVENGMPHPRKQKKLDKAVA